MSLPRKPNGERLRQKVQVLFTDADFLRLLQASDGKDLSAFCRDIILSSIDDTESLARFRATEDPFGINDERAAFAEIASRINHHSGAGGGDEDGYDHRPAEEKEKP